MESLYKADPDSDSGTHASIVVQHARLIPRAHAPAYERFHGAECGRTARDRHDECSAERRAISVEKTLLGRPARAGGEVSSQRGTPERAEEWGSRVKGG